MFLLPGRHCRTKGRLSRKCIVFKIIGKLAANRLTQIRIMQILSRHTAGGTTGQDHLLCHHLIDDTRNGRASGGKLCPADILPNFQLILPFFQEACDIQSVVHLIRLVVRILTAIDKRSIYIQGII